MVLAVLVIERLGIEPTGRDFLHEIFGVLRSPQSFDGELAPPGKRQELPTTAMGSRSGMTLDSGRLPMIKVGLNQSIGLGKIVGCQLALASMYGNSNGWRLQALCVPDVTVVKSSRVSDMATGSCQLPTRFVLRFA
jgi:hypothetical protein